MKVPDDMYLIAFSKGISNSSLFTKIIFREISNLERRFKMVIYKHTPRGKNEDADLLANEAIDEHNNKYQNNES